MENYKVKVSNEAESKEAQELFFALGYCWLGSGFEYRENRIGLMATGHMHGKDIIELYRSGEFGIMPNHKELTIQELRQLAGKESLKNTYAEIEQVRKEYLDSAKNYTYVQDTAKRSEDWIEIPEGADFYAEDGNLGIRKNYFFRLMSDSFSDEAIWTDNQWMRAQFNISRMKVLWSRYTQPDPLPFIDDEPQNATESRTSNKNSGGHTNPQQDANNATNANAWQSQVGGDHYKKLKIQPMEYALANKLDYAQANVVKYVTRHADKNGKEDLLKAIHNIQLMIEHYYAD